MENQCNLLTFLTISYLDNQCTDYLNMKSTRKINSLLITGLKLWDILPTNIQNILFNNIFKYEIYS